jgi:hypothetical protein
LEAGRRAGGRVRRPHELQAFGIAQELVQHGARGPKIVGLTGLTVNVVADTTAMFSTPFPWRRP